MSETQTPVNEGFMREFKDLQRKLADVSNQLARATSGHTKAGVPSDADYITPPPIGFYVVDTVGLKVYFRTAVGTWKATAVLT